MLLSSFLSSFACEQGAWLTDSLELHLFTDPVEMAATQVVMAEQGMGHPAVPWDGAPPKRKWRSKSTQPKYQMYSAIFQKGVKEPGLGPSRFKGSQKKKGLKARKFHDHRGSVPWTVPRAPFNDSSFLMQVRKCGGLAPVFPSPTISSYDFGSYQDLLDLEDYGYGSMTGLIRLRRVENDGDEWGGASTVVNDPDVINMCEVEQRLPSSPADSLERLEQRIDRGVSRFEIRGAAKQDRRIQDLQDENLLLKHRLLLVQQEVNELRQRLQADQSCNPNDSSETHSCFGG